MMTIINIVVIFIIIPIIIIIITIIISCYHTIDCQGYIG